MVKLIVQFGDSARDEACGLCSGATAQAPGPQLCLAENLAAVCRACARRHDEALCALLDLAQVAEQVGRVSAHSRLRVPLEMHLELARASEIYYSLAASRRRAA